MGMPQRSYCTTYSNDGQYFPYPASVPTGIQKNGNYGVCNGYQVISILVQDTQLERFLSGSRIAKGATTGDASESLNVEAVKCL